LRYSDWSDSVPQGLDMAYVRRISQVPITQVVKPIVVMNLKFRYSQSVTGTSGELGMLEP
jgi:hypothetical protein